MVLYISIRFNFKEINNYSVISFLTHPRRKVSHWILITTNIHVLHCKCLILQESLHRNNLWFDNFDLLKPLQRGMVSFYFKWFTSKYTVRLLTVQTITKHSILTTAQFLSSGVDFYRERKLDTYHLQLFLFNYCLCTICTFISTQTKWSFKIRALENWFWQSHTFQLFERTIKIGGPHDLVWCLLASEVSVAAHFEKITHFEKKFQSAVNLGPNQRTLKNIFKVR